MGNLDGRDVLHWLTQCHSTQEQLPGDREGVRGREDERERGKRKGWGGGERKGEEGGWDEASEAESKKTFVFHDVHVHSKCLACTRAHLRQV